MIKPFVIAGPKEEVIKKVKELESRIKNGEDPAKVAEELGIPQLGETRCERYSAQEIPSSFEEVVKSFQKCEMPPFSPEEAKGFVNLVKKVNPAIAFQMLAKHLSNIFLCKKLDELNKPINEWEELFVLDLAKLKIVRLSNKDLKDIKTFRNNAFFASEEEAKLTLELLGPLTEIINEQ